MPRRRDCVVHAHDYVTSHEHHHLRPVSRGGWTDPSNMVWLCANGHGDVHFFLDLIEKHRGPQNVPWRLAQHYSPAIRDTARAGWQRYADDFLAGVYARHAYLWSTSGEPRDHVDLRFGNTRLAVPPYAIAVQRAEVAHWLDVAEGRVAST